MELTIDRGHGYVPFTKNRREDDPIGSIPIDSIYSPVVKCNYNVSDTRVGNEMDYDKLTLELETDGSIKAIGLGWGVGRACKKQTLCSDSLTGKRPDG